jgi:hypothetical protein
MESIYPVGPTTLSPNLSKLRRIYKQRAVLAMIGLLMFVVLYFILTACFISTAYRLFSSSETAENKVFVALLSIFLAIFMLKPLFRVKHNYQSNSREISPKEEPQLFEFLYRLADGELENIEVIYGAVRQGAAFMFYPEVNAIFKARIDKRCGTPGFKRVPAVVYI